MKTILFVDDEPQILKALTRLFMDTEYDLFTAKSGSEALVILEEEDCDLVISDMKMPEMDGYQFLSIVKEKYPKILRVILSGYSEEKTVFQALRQNIAKVYVFKPWKNDDLLKLVEQIFETEDVLNTNELLLLINNTEDLPTIKVKYQKIISLIDEEAGVGEIANEIEHDQSIATKVLHIANSAYYGGKTGSIKQAVSYIGLKNIRNLVLSTSIFDSFDNKLESSEYLNKIWKHSFLTNKIINFLYEKCLNKKTPESFSVAGLLHNIGIVFLMKYFPEKYLEIFKLAVSQKKDLLKMEKLFFKVSHPEAGGYLLKWWELPFPIIEASLYHHNPFDERVINKEIVTAVHLAQKYAWNYLEMEKGTKFYMEVFSELDIEKENFEQGLEKFFDTLEVD